MLTFVNNYHEDIWLAYMFLAQDVCGEYGGFQAIGWYHIAPGQSSVPVRKFTRRREQPILVFLRAKLER